MHRAALGAFFWNPRREIFTLPFIDHPVVWYGAFFVIGLVLGYGLVFRLLQAHFQSIEKCSPLEARKETARIIDRFCWFLVAGTIVGARLGHILFYNWPYYRENLWRIFETWKGGLSSHGAGIGILIALFLFHRWVKKKHPSLTFLALMDMIVIPTALAGFFIRLGNFFNQELVGIPTRVPWAVVFGSPSDGSYPCARHPVQLYEAFTYMGIFFFLVSLWWRPLFRERRGFLCGLFFVLVFTSRIGWEFLKETVPSAWNLPPLLQTGQWLSIPYVLAGAALMIYAWTARPSKIPAKASDTLRSTR